MPEEKKQKFKEYQKRYFESKKSTSIFFGLFFISFYKNDAKNH